MQPRPTLRLEKDCCYDRVPDLYLDLSEYADADFAAQQNQRKDTE